MELLLNYKPNNTSVAIWKLSGVAATLTFAAALYWLTPAWKIRRDRLEPLNNPEVIGYLQQLRREVGLSCDPSFLRDPLNSGRNAVAFGHLRRYYVALDHGLVVHFYADRPLFRATVLHEFAHLYNRDINKTYTTVALWQAFLVASIVPTGASLLWYWESVPSDEVYLIVSIGLASTALVLLARNAVLRIREFYADLRASIWEGPSGSLARVLEKLRASKEGRWYTWLGVHPDPGERLQMLKDTRRLFRLGFWEAFGAGVAAVFIKINIHGLSATLWTDNRAVYALVLWAGSIALSISLAVGAVGIGIWRGQFIALMQGSVSRQAWRLGLALAFGMLFVELLMWAPFPAMLTATPHLSLFFVGLLVLKIAVPFCGAFLGFRWMSTAASVWLEVALRNRSPRLPLMISLAIGSGSLTLMFIGWAGLSLPWLFFSKAMWHSGNLSQIGSSGVVVVSLGVLFVMFSGFFILISTVGLWAFPLATWFWRKRVAVETTSTWAWLDGPLSPLPLPRPSVRPGLALIIGLAAGLLYSMLLALALYNKNIMPMEAYIVFFIFLSALMQAAAAGIAAVWIRRLGALHGLFAAFTAGFVHVLGWVMFALYKQFDGVVYISIGIVIAVMSSGMFLALPTALGASALRGWLVRPRGRMRSPATDKFNRASTRKRKTP